MKKHFRLHLLLWALAMPFLFSSCSDKDDLPVAYFNIEERGGTQHGGALYIQNGDSICIDRIRVAADKSTPTAMITACDYYWDRFFVGPAFAPDYARKFYVYNHRPGNHVLSIKMLVAAEGYPLATYVTNFPVIVTEGPADQTPDGTDLFTDRH